MAPTKPTTGAEAGGVSYNFEEVRLDPIMGTISTPAGPMFTMICMTTTKTNRFRPDWREESTEYFKPPVWDEPKQLGWWERLKKKLR